MVNELIPVNPPGVKETYEVPVIETVEVRVERGFQGTGGGSGDLGGEGGNPGGTDGSW